MEKHCKYCAMIKKSNGEYHKLFVVGENSLRYAIWQLQTDANDEEYLNCYVEFFQPCLPMECALVYGGTWLIASGTYSDNKKSCVKDSNHVSGYDICEIGIHVALINGLEVWKP